MKNPLIQLSPDKVIISEQGRAASRKWAAGDKPFVQFLEGARVSSPDSNCEEVYEELEPIEALQAIDEGSGNEGKGLRKGSSRLLTRGAQLTLDVGSRLEIEALPGVNNLIIRSTTRVNLGGKPQTYETRWEVIPEDL